MTVTVSLRLTLVLLVCLANGRSAAQEATVPVEMQYPLFVKIFSYEHSLADRSGDEITIGVLYQSRYRNSRKALEDLTNASRDGSAPSTIKGRPIRIVPLELEDESDAEELLQASGVDLLYVTPMRSFDLGRLLKACRSRRIVTFTGVPEYVEEGLSVGLDLMGGKPKILINMVAARAEGAAFSGQVLQLARIVKS